MKKRVLKNIDGKRVKQNVKIRVQVLFGYVGDRKSWRAIIPHVLKEDSIQVVHIKEDITSFDVNWDAVIRDRERRRAAVFDGAKSYEESSAP